MRSPFLHFSLWRYFHSTILYSKALSSYSEIAISQLKKHFTVSTERNLLSYFLEHWNGHQNLALCSLQTTKKGRFPEPGCKLKGTDAEEVFVFSPL